MPNQHKHAPISWRPPAELRGRLDAHTAETGRPVRAVITEAVDRYLLQEQHRAEAGSRPRGRATQDVSLPRSPAAFAASRAVSRPRPARNG
jgi:hypothetical protein